MCFVWTYHLGSLPEVELLMEEPFHVKEKWKAKMTRLNLVLLSFSLAKSNRAISLVPTAVATTMIYTKAVWLLLGVLPLQEAASLLDDNNRKNRVTDCANAAMDESVPEPRSAERCLDEDEGITKAIHGTQLLPEKNEYAKEACSYNGDEVSFGVKQTVYEETTRQTLEASVNYMKNIVVNNPGKYSKTIIDACKNQHRLCAFWAANGDCDNNPAYMKINCAPVCQSCDYIDFDNRCPRDPNLRDAWGPGDLNRMFERLIENSERYNVTVLSRPRVSQVGDFIRSQALEEIDCPWLVMMDNFLTDEGADRMIQMGSELGFQRSLEPNGTEADGSYKAAPTPNRTSYEARCLDSCQKDDVTRAIRGSLEEVTGVPQMNIEQYLLLRYEPGQLFRLHHDYNDLGANRPAGPRILTFFLYLSDVNEGGGTNFPGICNGKNITVSPKKGRALLWPNVMNANPEEKDPRLQHAGLPVEKGIKFALSTFLYLRNFQAAYEARCT